ncbi:MAG TPA: 3-methylornithyl-N6-L-lysine dehydrogenase PylD [Desulfosporosinus sp.]|nr:3-methylornithyl-N6-L-lysine dehydrogenase PylD [Desulfosporosinus sp.]
MTRLKQDDVIKIATTLEEYNAELVRMTGCSLREIATYAVGKGVSEDNVRRLKVAVIPMTCGQGVIEGFVESVASIIGYLGFNAVITKSQDAGGVAEAIQNGSDILFMADDDRFVAVNVRTGKVSDNGEATGKGYVAGLVHMCDGVEGKKVLVIGAGPVGTGAALALKRFGAEVSIYDIDLPASQKLSEVLIKQGYAAEIETDLDAALGSHCILMDACPGTDLIKLQHLSDYTIIAAPGIPLGVEAAGVGQLSKRLLHDPLQIGVATMIFDVI